MRLARLTAPFFYWRSGQGAYNRYLREARATQWLSPSALAALRERKLRALLRHAAARVPYYRAMARDRGLDTDRLGGDSLEAFPLLTKAVLADPDNGLLADGVDPAGLTERWSSGSSGVRSRVLLDADRGFRGWAWNSRHNEWAGLRPGVRVASLWSRPLARPDPEAARNDRLWRAVVDALSGRYREVWLDPYHAEPGRMREFLRAAARLRPHVLIGYSQALRHLALVAREEGFTALRPRAVITGGETLPEDARPLLREVFGAEIFDRYGTREVDILASGCEAGAMHLNDDHLVVEVLSRAPGEPGEVVVTDLHNYSYPIIRVALGDLAVLSDHPCRCGRGLRVLERIVGRAGDLFWTSSGVMVSSGALMRLVARSGAATRYRVHQMDYHHLRFSLVLAPGAGETEIARLVEAARELFGPATRVDVEVHADLRPDTSGKFRYVRSDVSGPPPAS